uniref:Uncharacterized protein n=1 Tax=Glossina pallidipes TaxID=7398 RepID=A0A1B0A6Q3_GLOPL
MLMSWSLLFLVILQSWINIYVINTNDFYIDFARQPFSVKYRSTLSITCSVQFKQDKRKQNKLNVSTIRLAKHNECYMVKKNAANKRKKQKYRTIVDFESILDCKCNYDVNFLNFCLMHKTNRRNRRFE